MKKLSIALIVASFCHTTQALDAVCKMPATFDVEGLSPVQVEKLHKLANHLLSGKQIGLEEFEENSQAIETTAFAVSEMSKCEKESATIIAVATDARLSLSNLARVLKKAMQPPKYIGVACFSTVRLKTKNCLEMALIK